MSNVKTGDLAWIVHPMVVRLMGRSPIVEVGQQATGQCDVHCTSGYVDTGKLEPTMLHWWIASSIELPALRTRRVVHWTHKLPIRDSDLRKITGPDVLVGDSEDVFSPVETKAETEREIVDAALQHYLLNKRF